jgi:DNA-directed RNA polymerase subunit RPC12/RpoP
MMKVTKEMQERGFDETAEFTLDCPTCGWTVWTQKLDVNRTVVWCPHCGHEEVVG